MRYWIEITNPVHGGLGWEFGTCLWSPVHDRSGKKAWKMMEEVEPGDVIFHFLKPTKQQGHHFWGHSVAEDSAQIINYPPPEPLQWANQAPYYRIPVVSFNSLGTPVSVSEMLESKRSEFEAELQRKPKGQFYELKKDGRIQVSLKYIAEADGQVVDILSEIVQANGQTLGSTIPDHFVPDANSPAYPDYTPPGTVQTQVVRRIRDTALSKRVKEEFEHKCAICGKRIQLNENTFYAEAHHIKPLGAGHNGPDVRENLITLCPYHHAEFDYGIIAIEPTEHKIIHLDKNETSHNSSPVYDVSYLNTSFLSYHIEYIFRGNLTKEDTRR